MNATSPSEHPGRRADLSIRVAEVILGLASVVFAVVALANPRASPSLLVFLLALALGFLGIEELVSGGLHHFFLDRFHPTFLRTWLRPKPFAIVIVGGATLLVAVVLVVDPQIGVDTAVLLVGMALIVQALGRILFGASYRFSEWIGGSAIATGILTIFAVGVSFFVPGLALLTLAILMAVILLVNGLASVVMGLKPTGPRQVILLKLILFSALYGLVLINWIDLYRKGVPGYSIWLLLTYMAPFGVILVFEGWKEWPLAISLGLLVSLMNDVGYFFVGNLIFGFHVNLERWLSGQLGLRGDQIVTIFRGGAFTYRVTSAAMGLSIYLRAIVVSTVLYYWWRRAAVGAPAPVVPVGTLADSPSVTPVPEGAPVALETTTGGGSDARAGSRTET